ncbi:hypothetical protein Taro_020775 [Colocasia esculenta]|uniref:DNA helicase n=1 Tax=Colocasia esculenta TaxID=4460 RepID=A0A843V332_COLES|nr:hypothetical protein [Colocasia esculenta]
MAPKKRVPSSSSSRRSNQSIHQSQPAKFGIQHFFERHSQATAAAAATVVSSTPSNLTNPSPDTEPEPTRCDPPATAAAPQNVEEKECEDPTLLSPEIGKTVSVKRFRFSPGMLIKQSQDDGAEEVTWKISPVNERLRSFTTKQLQDATVASKLSASRLRPCSQENSPCFGERLEKWMCSPTMVAPGKTVGYSKRVSFQDMLHRNGSDNNADSSTVSMMELQSPFRTPPSTSYVSLEPVGDASCHGTSDQLGSIQHRKALLELLDQVEDAIAVESSSDGSTLCLTEGHMKDARKMHIMSEKQHKASVDISEEQHKMFVNMPEGDISAHCNQNFLVLEVYLYFYTFKSLRKIYSHVLRLLNEQSGQERALHLCDEWLVQFYSLIGPGDTINVIGKFNGQDRCVVDRHKNLLIIHPQILVSGTRVASSFSCPRRAVLDERLKTAEHSSSALIGTLLHQIFQNYCFLQAGLLKDFPTRAFMEEYAGNVLQQNIEHLYACGASESDTYTKLIEAIPRMLDWINVFRDGQAHVLCLSPSIIQVIDIEEMAWAPRYGLKGMIDASLRVKMGSVDNVPNEKIIPLELKTGKGTSGQVSFSFFLVEGMDGSLRPSLLETAAMEHRAQVILYTLLMSERCGNDWLLSHSLFRYLNRGIDSGLIYYLHTNQTQGIKVQRSDLVGIIMRRNELATDILKASTSQCLPPMLWVLVHLYAKAVAISMFVRCIIRLMVVTGIGGFLRGGAKRSGSGRANRAGARRIRSIPWQTADPGGSRLRAGVDSLRCGRIEPIRSAVQNHAAKYLAQNLAIRQLPVALSRHLRLPGSSSSTVESDLACEIWRIDKDNAASSYAIMRFDSGGILSQDPAISYVQSKSTLNDDQRRAIHKILAAKDYALILGMPGTGKTSTMGIDFIRIGRKEAVHDGIREHCHSATATGKQNLEDVKQKMEHVRVVGVTCLGINHPLLAKRKFDVCIMDEAGQIALPVCIEFVSTEVSLGPLMFATKFVLVGDHYQLPPLVQSAEALENGLGISLFRRLSEAHPHAISALQCQYRMCAGIMELSNALIYGNRLRCGSPDIANAKLKFSCGRQLKSWIKECLSLLSGEIYSDTLPAHEIVRELVNRDVAGDDIGIITPYNSQVDLIRRTAGAAAEIHTIDKYQLNILEEAINMHLPLQGRDKDCILVSFVRSNDRSTSFTASLLGDWHRINVALTRAKVGVLPAATVACLSTLRWCYTATVQSTRLVLPTNKIMIHERTGTGVEIPTVSTSQSLIAPAPGSEHERERRERRRGGCLAGPGDVGVSRIE